MKQFKITSFPNDTEIHVIIEKDWEKAKKAILRLGYRSEGDPDFDFDGLTLGLPSRGIVVYLKELDYSVIAHELIHVSWLLQNTYGLHFDVSCDETQAYIVSDIMDKIIDKLNEKR